MPAWLSMHVFTFVCVCVCVCLCAQGKVLTNGIKAIHADFQAAVERFQGVQYDVMDTDAKAFDEDFYAFRVVIRELERRLAAIIIQAFDDCTTISMTFKLLDSFEGLLDREVIAANLEKKHADLLYAYACDLKDVSDIFHAYKDHPVVARNSAPHSGAVAWVRGLVERIEEPIQKLRTMNKAIMEMDQARDIEKTFESLMAQMREYQGKQVALWCERVAATSDEKLNQPLLSVANGTLGVNFDPELVRLLRETKYFILLKVEVPDAAQNIFQHSDTFRQQISSLDLICSIYNKIQRTILAVEKPLVDQKLYDVEVALRRGQEELNWKVSTVHVCMHVWAVHGQCIVMSGCHSACTYHALCRMAGSGMHARCQ